MGEDYELLFTVKQDDFDKIKANHLKNLNIGLFNKIDLNYLQSFFAIVNDINTMNDNFTL